MTKKQFSLQERISQLEKIEAYFEKPDIDLDEGIEKHKEALSIAQEILSYLDKAENTLEQLNVRELQTIQEALETDATI